MKKTLILILLLLSVVVAHAQGLSDDREQYRRSSLCLILLTHRDKKYAQEMERIFNEFPLPARYNEHNITGLRVISVTGKQNKSDIDRLVTRHDVARKIVGRWFNRDPYTGQMDMELIHDRGGYGASYADYQQSQSNIRGVSMLRDEGIELLQSTFVLVCDMDYIDKKKGAAWGAVGLAILSVGMQGLAAANYGQANQAMRNGDYAEAERKRRAAQNWNLGSGLASVGSAVVADIGGFRVKMNAYLYKLQWNNTNTNTFFNSYWVDNDTPYSDLQHRKDMFDNDRNAFSIKFVGKYSTSSSKTILRSWSNEDEVILDVCHRCVNKGLTELAKAFPVFRPRSPFYIGSDGVYSHIGTKEEVTAGRKYEIIQPYKDKKGQIQYKRVGKARAGYPWNNSNIRFDEYFDSGEKGTRFYCSCNSSVLNTPGLQLREL